MYSRKVLNVTSAEICRGCKVITINHRITLRFEIRHSSGGGTYGRPAKIYVFASGDEPLPAYVRGKNANHLQPLPGGYHYVSTWIHNQESNKQVREAVIACAEIALGAEDLRSGYDALPYVPTTVAA